jgi:RimJ/RimL family protein N-acetyltransferase
VTLILDQKERCLAFVSEQIGNTIGDGAWYQAIGFERDGRLIVAVIYTHMTEYDIVMHVAAEKGARWCTREFLSAAFRYPFVQLGLKRVTGFVPSANLEALKLNKHLGFRVEGLMRDGSEGCDMVVMGMLAAECRWVKYGTEEKVESSRAA